MARIATVVVVGLFIGACIMTPEKWAAVPDGRICAHVGNVRSSYYGEYEDGVAELVSRRKIRPEYVRTVRAKKIALGMNACELLASWGPPTDVNRSVHQWGTNTQWVYGRLTSSRGVKYVYTENQVVTSWQE